MNQALINLVNEDCKKSCTDGASFETLNHQTILVTGGTGFMGKWIAEMVSHINGTYFYHIKLILLGRDIERFKKEVPHLAKKSFIHLVEQDVRNLHDLPEEISWVIHAAGTPDNREHASQPLRTIETIYKGTHSILDTCFRLPNLQKLVHISSHQVYGNVADHTPIKESVLGKVECNTVNSAYAEAKRLAETLCAIYRNQQQLPITIVRPFAFVGPYQSLEKPWAINNFIRDALLGGPIRILGNGATIRSYLYGSDMAYWLLKILVKGKAGNTYNVGSSESISLNDLAQKIAGLIDKKIPIVSKSSRENYTDFSMAVPDTAKVTKDTGVKELFDLESALQRTIYWNQLFQKKA
jgi:dTDP-glucose 4,6-dehydratase